MPEQKTPVSGAFWLASLMYFCSGKPMHFCSGVDKAAFFGPTVANGALRTWLDLQLAPPSRD